MTSRLFSGKDYDQLVSALLARMRQKFPAFDIQADDEPMRLILDAMAFGLEQANFFVDVSGAERYLGTAQRASNVARIAAEFGYNPPGAVACSGVLGLSLAQPYSFVVTLPIGYEFASDRGAIYTTTEELSWAPGDTSEKQVVLSQIVNRERSFTSNGERLQRLELGGLSDLESLAFQSVEVRVNGDEWLERDSFLDTDTTVYRVAYTAKPPYIEFGDGAVGSVPNLNASVVVRFSLTLGESGELTTPGRISGGTQPLVIGGTQIQLLINRATGVMTGGAGPEQTSKTRALAPLYKHSDGAVCTDADFTALASLYRHGIYGAVSSARAVLATSLNNDLLSASLIGQIEGTFLDASNEIQAVQSELASAVSSLAVNRGNLLAIHAALDSFLGAAQALTNRIDALEVLRVQLSTSVNATDLSAADIQNVTNAAAIQLNQLDVNRSALLSAIQVIGPGPGPDALSAATYAALIGELSSMESGVIGLQSKLSGSGVIQASAASIRGQATTSKSTITSIRTELEQLAIEQANAQSDLASLVSLEGLIEDDGDEVAQASQELTLKLTDPWSITVGLVQNLKIHLDKIFTSECGPNVVSVVILASDADGFYVAPSIGLQRALEEYLEPRREPSVRVVVVDGSRYLVVPRISVLFRVVQGYDPVKVKNLMQSEIVSLHRGRQAGQGLDLDDIYGAVNGVEGLLRSNIEITGFDAAPGTSAVIDNEGNLAIGSREIITRPIITYFRILPDGSRELV